MSEDVRIPFTFVVKKVTWRPAGEAMPEEPQDQVLLGPNGQSLPIRTILYPEPGVLQALTEQGRREYYEEKAAKAKEERRRAREAEAARWKPMPISPDTPPLVANLYRNLRRLKTPPANSDSTNDVEPTPQTSPPVASDPSDDETQQDQAVSTPHPMSPSTQSPNPIIRRTWRLSSLKYGGSSDGGTTSSSPQPSQPTTDTDLASLSTRTPEQTQDRASNPLAASNGTSLLAVADTPLPQAFQQRSSRDRPIIQVQDDEELVGPAIAAARQLRNALQAEYDEMNAIELPSIADKLTQSESSATTSIETSSRTARRTRISRALPGKRRVLSLGSAVEQEGHTITSRKCKTILGVFEMQSQYSVKASRDEISIRRFAMS